MSVAKVTEITARSNKSFDDAIQQGLNRAKKTLDNIQGAWVKEQKVIMDNGNISGYQVDLKLTFELKN
ncbi:dodecin domain-containing protein [Persicimonas caeni]|uniref:Dodecin domain-containing protein n=1 Tax=Persicimonas caeni TaxID=2292766 RepID=A0A4Y6PYQ4_PERCE|nr:dodecin family protein [Persicimonas caeni]QDG52865.1 dodecin domain-containing protein [Persicimonas caeni]QED34087.1 dodecin domain-containing protein [Persicimonas caeni]